jgi:hypothetical protein
MAVRVGPLIFAIVAVAGLRVGLAQTDAQAIPELSGTWSLNFEASSAASDVVKTAPTPPPPDAPGRPVGPGGATDGASSPRGPLFTDPTKTGSLLPPNFGTPSTPPAAPKDKGRKLTTAERLLLELTTPPSALTVKATRDAVTVTREGRTDVYKTDGAEEKHKLINGSVKTKTTWQNQTLRQELTAGDVKLVRTMELDASKRLIVITKPADDKSLMFETQLISRLGTDSTAKGRKRAVYDPEK